MFKKSQKGERMPWNLLLLFQFAAVLFLFFALGACNVLQTTTVRSASSADGTDGDAVAENQMGLYRFIDDY